MDFSVLITLFMLLGLLFLAASQIVVGTRLAMAIISVVCFGVAVVLDIILLVR